MTDTSYGTGTAVPDRVEPRPDPAPGGRGVGGRVRGIGLYYRQVINELRKVIWPTRKELITYTTVVLFFVVVMVAIVAGLDFIFTKGVLAVFG